MGAIRNVTEDADRAEACSRGLRMAHLRKPCRRIKAEISAARPYDGCAAAIFDLN